ncbi:hypothetical protein [Bacillus gaemokensis]|uniref:Uncharacterized protein n=1 Tax=Bacillus gaemokensis TaxID=574375 RepID=A0A073K2W4_9BACI|nr:hypothetical protein [Bacillus gaemokensis]KEK21659.1 hypothetical protein BAGA_27420 [Bacillus gaemokensis]KYG32912.1 hypothetical protein AZF08_27380 [Bacillus gaemokensis]
MKKLGKTILSGIILSSGLLFGTSDAFAMGSKGSGNMGFSTDANVYSRNATSIDVSGWTSAGNVAIELVTQGGNVVAREDRYFGVDGGSFNVSFPTRGLSTGLYDVHVNGGWGANYYHRELTSYLKVNY